jgi:ribonuclease VapC
MFIDACAIIAVLADEPGADRMAAALAAAQAPITSSIVMLEVALALARPDKFNCSAAVVTALIDEFLEARGIVVRDLPPAVELTRLTLSAAHRYRSGRRGLNLGDCLHYACAKYYGVPILATDGEFSQTDVEIVR